MAPKGKSTPLRHHALNRSAAAAAKVASGSPAKTAGSDAMATSTMQRTAEELAEIQGNEFLALESILASDFRVIDLDADSPWKMQARAGPSSPAQSQQQQQLAFEITIRPDTDALKSLVSVNVRFRLPKRYPLLPPIVSVISEGASGLSSEQLKGLQDLLTTKSKTLVIGGDAIVFELYNLGQDFVSRYNTELSTVDPELNISLDEEKRHREIERAQAESQREQQDEERRTKEQQDRADKIAQLIQEQSDRQSIALAEERAKKKHAAVGTGGLAAQQDNGLHHPYDTSSSFCEATASTTEQLLGEARASHRKIETFIDAIKHDGISTHHLVVGPILSRRDISSVYAVEAADAPGAGCWHMETFEITSRYYNLSSGKRRLAEVEWELDKLNTLRSDNLVNVLGAALVAQVQRPGDQSSPSSSAKKYLNIVTEAVDGPQASLILSYGLQLPWKRVRVYLVHILTALDLLHSRNILHRSVNISNVILQDSRDGQPHARLARAGYAQRMLDLNADNPIVDKNALSPSLSDLPSGWQAPEILNDSDGEERLHQHTRKRDIWNTGVVTVQMLFGSDVIRHYDSPSALFSAKDGLFANSPSHVATLLQAMLDNSTRKRPTANEMRSRLEEAIAFETDELGAASTTILPGKASVSEHAERPSNARRPFVRTRSQQDDPFRAGSFWQMRGGGQRAGGGGGNSSRYEDDFEELNLLGKGAYGAVYRARNRLDGRDYAIKKIRLSSSAENDEKTLREITALSRLSHQNIVRYVTCWIQVQIGGGESTMTSSINSETQTSSLQTGSRQFRLPNINDDFLSASHDALSQGGSHIIFGNSDSESDSDNEPVLARSSNRHVSYSDSEGDSESESDESSENESASNRDNAASRGANGSRIVQSASMGRSEVGSSEVRFLFIQMEYVENETLKEAIDEGLSIDESWRIFRQIVEALAHVASLGIIHRDLKPSNILMFGKNADGEGDPQSKVGSVKLGDFGLATTTPNQQGEGAPAYGPTDDTDQTNDIGTSLYIAPEVVRGGNTRYDSKVDIYACGIVFFEMLASQRIYKTGMERIHIIRELRTPEIRFPAGWNEAQMFAQTKLLRKMLSHNPSERPSPLEILKSDLLPPKMEDEYISECMRLLSMPNSTYNLQLMDSLFNREESFEHREARDLTFDAGSNEVGQAGLDNRFVALAAQHLRGVFRLRGAVEMEAPLLLPPNDLYNDEKVRPVELLDKTGKVVQLPYDLVTPFARMIARGQQHRLKRFAIAHVYRPNLLAGGQPRSVSEVDYDIIAPEKTPAAEAEILSVIDDILEEVPGLSSDEWTVQISHTAIFDLIIERVPVARRQFAVSAISVISNGTRAAAAEARQQLLNLGLTRSILEEIESANLSDDIDTVNKKLERLVAFDLRPSLVRAVDEIREVINAAQQFGVQRRFQFTPLLMSNRAFYKDAVYFVVVRTRGKRRDVLASGGRYDALLKRFADPTRTRPPSHAVGVQIALGRIALALARHHENSGGVIHNRTGADDERTFGPFTPRRCEVYVASALGLLPLRMEICRELWAANISADLAYEHALEESPELLASTCRAEGIQFLVIARSRGSTVKVKAVLNRTEHEVHRWELTGWLLDRLQRVRGSVENTSGLALGNAERPLLFPSASGASINPGAGGLSTSLQAADVEVILPERYTYDKRKADKHGTSDTRRGRKQAYLGPMQENAARQVSKLTEELSQMSIAPPAASGGTINAGTHSSRLPVVAVDVGPSTNAFHRLCAAALARDDEALWKLFMETLTTVDEREYGRTLRQRIGDVQGRAWLVSIRSDGAVAMI